MNLQNYALIIEDLTPYVSKSFIKTVLEQHHFGSVSDIIINQHWRKPKATATASIERTATIYFYDWFPLRINTYRQQELELRGELKVYYADTQYFTIKLLERPIIGYKPKQLNLRNRLENEYIFYLDYLDY